MLSRNACGKGKLLSLLPEEVTKACFTFLYVLSLLLWTCEVTHDFIFILKSIILASLFAEIRETLSEFER